MTHGRDCPHRCSMCLQAVPRRVTHDGHQLLLDGKPTGRTLDREQERMRVQYARNTKRRAT